MKSLICPIDSLTPAQMQDVAARIDAGAAAVYPTDTVYGLGTCAFDESAISRIYEIKERPASSALQILVGSAEQARAVAKWDDRADKLARAFWPGGLTMIVPASEKGAPLLRGFAGLGLRVPAHPSLARLLRAMKAPLASTSANLHGRPVISDERELAAFFDGKADIVLTGGILSRRASSVVDITAEPRLLREGAVPRGELEKVLGCPLK